jgi:general stress protein 26
MIGVVAMDNNKEILNLGIQLMEESEIVCLSTNSSEGYPETRAMLNLRNPQRYPGLVEFFASRKDDFATFFTTNTSSRKLRQLTVNPKVSVYFSHPATWRGLMLAGDMEIIDDAAVKGALWQPGWEIYYPGGALDPDYAVLMLNPKYAAYYGQLSVLRWERE